MSTERSFTGRSRKRTTSPTIWWTDRIAKYVIGIGGIGTIVTVLLVFVFLVGVAIPLFRSATVEERVAFDADWRNGAPVLSAVDEYRTMGWALFKDGNVHCFDLSDGKEIGKPVNVGQVEGEDVRKLTAASSSVDSDVVAMGFEDGSIRQGKIGFTSSFIDPLTADDAIKRLDVGEVAVWQEGTVTRTPSGLLRLQKLNVDLDPPAPTGSKFKVQLVNIVSSSSGPILSTLTEDGKLRLSSVSKKVNLITDEVTVKLSSSELPLPASVEDPSYLLISGLGDNIFVAWKDGKTLRFDTRNFAQPQIAEQFDMVPEDGEQLTSLQFLLGQTTLVAGDSTGRLQTWFATRPEAPAVKTPDNINMVAAHTFPATGAAVTSLSSSSRVRMFAAGYQDGTARVFYVTSERQILDVKASDNSPVQDISISPKSDALICYTKDGIAKWTFDPAHPEVTLRTLFLPVWYEGYAGSGHSWQSSSGTDKFEPKFGLTPLVFGTIKATIYSMLFGAPLALLAAIYSSEFLNPRVKSQVKPVIEMMASLPSVVLGFLAGIVIAPLIEDVVPSVLSSFLLVPLSFVIGAYLWQLIPNIVAIRFAFLKFPLMLIVALPLGLLMAWWIGPVVERVMFSGDFKGWLNGRVGDGTPGWFIMLLPLSALLVSFFTTAIIQPMLRERSVGWTRQQAALTALATFIVGCLVTIAFAYVGAFLLSALQFDPRGTFVGTYVQRNAMIVGFMMGFAIIPIIYTIADDALSSVPATLRSASLGAGATNWQTAIRVIMPTAMSGLFSALMIGLGRAVGETMIVLMAAGNTPIIDMNIFNGFQTLSANIATELPEAVPGSTHYRTLFLAALTLFVMTFFINTIAEMIRQRFRKRAYEL